MLLRERTPKKVMPWNAASFLAVERGADDAEILGIPIGTRHALGVAGPIFSSSAAKFDIAIAHPRMVMPWNAASFLAVERGVDDALPWQMLSSSVAKS